MPANGRSVARPTKWGNPWIVERLGDLWTVRCDSWPGRADFRQELDAYTFAVERHRLHLLEAWDPYVKVTVEDAQRELAGFDLGCYCALDRPCHRNTLLAAADGSLVA